MLAMTNTHQENKKMPETALRKQFQAVWGKRCLYQRRYEHRYNRAENDTI